jgi:hypothetical protein
MTESKGLQWRPLNCFKRSKEGDYANGATEATSFTEILATVGSEGIKPI